ncbi:MAG: hypothetical protein ACKVQB_00945, partial [Bacteroidia bacterium]
MKVLQALYAYHQSEIKDLKSAKSFLKKSINGIEDTFINILQFSSDLFHFIKTNYNPADRHLKLKTDSGLAFNYLSNNKCLNVLTEFPKSKELFTAASYNWAKEKDFLFLIYKQIGETDLIMKMENRDINDFETNREFLLEFYKYLIETSDDFN